MVPCTATLKVPCGLLTSSSAKCRKEDHYVIKTIVNNTGFKICFQEKLNRVPLRYVKVLVNYRLNQNIAVYMRCIISHIILISPVCLQLKGGFWPQSRITDHHCGNKLMSSVPLKQRTWVQSGSHSQPSNKSSHTVVCWALIDTFFSCQNKKLTWQATGSSFDSDKWFTTLPLLKPVLLRIFKLF